MTIHVLIEAVIQEVMYISMMNDTSSSVEGSSHTDPNSRVRSLRRVVCACEPANKNSLIQNNVSVLLQKSWYIEVWS